MCLNGLNLEEEAAEQQGDDNGRAGFPKMVDLCGGTGPHKMAGPGSGAAFKETIKSPSRTGELSQRTKTTELAPLKRDVQNFPFSLSSTTSHSNTNKSMFPLREVPIHGAQGGLGFVNVPLNSIQVGEFKREITNRLEDPLGLAEQLDHVLGPNISIWEEMPSILGILFTPEERQMIKTAGIRIWERENPPNVQGRIPDEQKSPLVRPNWDQNTTEGRNNMSHYRRLVIRGIREAAPKGQNFEKAFENKQQQDEPPTVCLQRLRKNVQEYSAIDLESAAG